MEAMAKKYAVDAHFIFVYSREAHPGELYPPLESIEQKIQHAKDFRERLGTERPILIDSLYGRVHRIFGGVSNMAWIIDHTGHVSYRAAWTVADDIESALEETLEMRRLRREGKGAVAFYREIMGLRAMKEQVFLGGKIAEQQFKDALAGLKPEGEAKG